MTARDELRAVARAFQPEIEDLCRRMLSALPEGHSVGLNDLQDRDVVSVLGEVESDAWNRTVEAIWLDACLARGFGYHFPQPAERVQEPEVEDG